MSKTSEAARRRARAIEKRHDIQRRIKPWKLELTITAEGGHWQFRANGKVVAHWWPGTGRLTVLGISDPLRHVTADSMLKALTKEFGSDDSTAGAVDH